MIPQSNVFAGDNLQTKRFTLINYIEYYNLYAEELPVYHGITSLLKNNVHTKISLQE